MGPGTTREHPGLCLTGPNSECKAERERQKQTEREKERERHQTEMLAKMIKREQINNL